MSINFGSNKYIVLVQSTKLVLIEIEPLSVFAYLHMYHTYIDAHSLEYCNPLLVCI